MQTSTFSLCKTPLNKDQKYHKIGKREQRKCTWKRYEREKESAYVPYTLAVDIDKVRKDGRQLHSQHL